MNECIDLSIHPPIHPSVLIRTDGRGQPERQRLLCKVAQAVSLLTVALSISISYKIPLRSERATKPWPGPLPCLLSFCDARIECRGSLARAKYEYICIYTYIEHEPRPPISLFLWPFHHSAHLLSLCRHPFSRPAPFFFPHAQWCESARLKCAHRTAHVPFTDQCVVHGGVAHSFIHSNRRCRRLLSRTRNTNSLFVVVSFLLHVLVCFSPSIHPSIQGQAGEWESLCICFGFLSCSPKLKGISVAYIICCAAPAPRASCFVVGVVFIFRFGFAHCFYRPQSQSVGRSVGRPAGRPATHPPHHHQSPSSSCFARLFCMYVCMFFFFFFKKA